MIQSQMQHKISIHTLNRVLNSLQAAKNGPALWALLATFCIAGMLLAMAESALARGDSLWGVVWAGLALTAAFYGVNTTGLLVMDQALGRPVRRWRARRWAWRRWWAAAWCLRWRWCCPGWCT
jgi:hypothetical protein